MLSLESRFVVSVCLGIGALPGVVVAQQPRPVGGEFQVNVFTPYSQSAPAVGVASNGDFVVAWRSDDQEQSGSAFVVASRSLQDLGYGIFARRFDAAGSAQGAEFQVNSFALYNQSNPSIGVASNGAFVVAWQSAAQDGVYYGVFARRFDAGGGVLGAEFQVNTYTPGYQFSPAVGMASDGAFVVAWLSYLQDGSGSGIFAQRFDAGGSAQGAEFQVNGYTTSHQFAPAVGMASDGDFVIAWASAGQDGANYGVFARRFDAGGTGQGAEFQVNAYTTGAQTIPAVSVAIDGAFVVAWQSEGQDGASYGVFARRFDAGGGAQGAEFQVNTHTSGYQIAPAVDVASDGAFVVAWQSGAAGVNYGVFARRFDAGGGAQGAEFQVNAYTSGYQIAPAVGVADGDFVVAWTSFPQDGSGQGVFAQRYQVPGVLDIDGNGSVDPLTDGLLVLRYLFGFAGATLVDGAVDTVGCTRCDAASIEAYLATLI